MISQILDFDGTSDGKNAMLTPFAIDLMTLKFRRVRRAINFVLFAWYRHPVFTHVFALAFGIVSGVLLCSYWTCIVTFVRTHGVGEVIRVFLPVGSALFGIAVFWWQVSRARYNQRIDLILKLAERFDKSEMRAIRAKAAKELRRNRDTDDGSVSDVLNFIEEIGFLHERRAIDLEAVYEFFEYWVIPYHHATKQYCHSAMEDGAAPDQFSNAHKLFDALVKFEYRKTGNMPSDGDKEIDEFLLEESKLVPQVRSKFSIAENVGRKRAIVGSRG